MATKNFLADLGSTVKQEAVKRIGASFGKGLIGRSLGKAFVQKFNAREQDTQVESALETQRELLNNNNTTLARIETVVVNISDNVYNIAGILNAQVTSMQETKRLYEMQKSRDLAAQEEAANEASRVAAPSTAATVPTPEEDKKGGTIQKILGAVSFQKKGLIALLKKFAVTVGVPLAAALGGAALANAAEVSPVPSDAESTSTAAQEPEMLPEPPTSISDLVEEGKLFPEPTQPVSTSTKDLQQPSATQPDTTFNVPQVVSAPPIVASEVQIPPSVPTYLAKPENSVDRQQYIALTSQLARAERVAEGAQQMIESDPSSTTVNQYRQILLNAQQTIERTKQAKTELEDRATATAPAQRVERMEGEATPSSVAAMPNGTSSMPPQATLIEQPLSTGTEIGTQSANVAAASEPQPSTSQTIGMNAGTTTHSKRSHSTMPSPVASRGSLDIDTTFSSRG